jgi:parvulin-like peptidyl-prolyl isomerase
MSQNNDDMPEEQKDYTKHIWVGVILALIVMIGAIAIQGDRSPANSEVATKHILVSFNRADPADRSRALERIQEVKQRLENGERFESLASQYSDDPGSAAAGGYIPPQPRGTFQDSYEKYVWSAPEGEVSDIIQTTYGFHLVVVVDRYISDADDYEHQLDLKLREERTGGNESDAEKKDAGQ